MFGWSHIQHLRVNSRYFTVHFNIDRNTNADGNTDADIVGIIDA